MGALPPGQGPQSNQSANQNTRFAAYLNGVFIPTWAGEVELSAYGTADNCSVTTFLGENTTDYSAISQSGKYLPLIIKVGTVGSKGLNCQLLAAYLEEIDSNYDDDEIVVHGRGILAPLIDKRVTAKLNQNLDLTLVIEQMLASVPGLQFDVNGGQLAGVKAGKVVAQDHISVVRDMRAMDYINTLADAVGWRTRVVGATVIIGPPNENSPVLAKVYGGPSGGMKLNVKHNALHSHNIHVHVVSHIMRTKQTTRKVVGPTTVYQATTNSYITIPAQTPPNKARLKSSGGTQGGNTSGVASGNIPDVGEQEEYTFSYPGKDANDCNAIASLIQAELSRHEFIAELEWAPTPAEIQFLCANGVEWQLQLSGCQQSAHNQTYHPKRINWTYSDTEGLIVRVLAVNHLLPQGATEAS